MSDQTLVRLGRGVAAMTVALAVGSAAIALTTGELGFWWRSYAGVMAVLATAFGVFVWLVVAHQPRNGAVWAMAASIGAAVNAVAFALVPLLTSANPHDVLGDQWVPADSPAPVGWVLVIGQGASLLGLFVPLTLGLMLFPNGRLPSRRWRPIAAIAVVSLAVASITHGLWYRPTNASREEWPVIPLAVVTMALTAVAAVVSLVGRFRRSTGTLRLQYKWIVWGTGVGVAVFGGFAFLPDTAVGNDWLILVAALATVCWVVSYGIAVGRYRLYEIDLVISRSVVFVSLAVLITGIYVVVVVAAGSVVGGSDLVLSVLATALVAIVFEPARTRSQRWANRLVYGRRATPYEVLGELTRLLAVAESGEALLERLATQLRAATGARRVTVWTDDDGDLRPIAAAPSGAGPASASAVGPAAPRHDFPIEHDGETLGRLTVEQDPGDTLRPPERRLAEDLAASASLVVARVRLDHALAAKATEIEQSRRRLVGAQDDELRRLERVLNNSVGDQVVALKVQVGLAEQLARREGDEQVADLLGRLGGEAQAAIDQIRSLAQGIHPPLLATDGLGAAVSALADTCPLPVELDLDLHERHPVAVDAAVYFCVSEALTNASKHALGPVRVTLADGNGCLRLRVTDSGPGFDSTQPATGSGLHNMADRIDALGGRLTIESRVGAATSVAATLPVAAPPAERAPLDSAGVA